MSYEAPDQISTDLLMRKGVRIFLSGGAYSYDVPYLRRMRAALNNTIKDKTKHIDEPIHYSVDGKVRGMVVKVAACSKSLVRKSTTDPDKVYCGACENTKQYRADIGEVFEDTIIHLDHPHPLQKTACNVWTYAGSSAFNTVKSWKRVTCGSCKRTNAYLKLKAADTERKEDG